MLYLFPFVGLGQGSFQMWITYNNQARLSEKWGLHTDYNYRTRGVFPFNSSLLAVRIGAMYHLNQQARLTGGYAWFGTHVNKYNFSWLPEHRLWQQWQQTIQRPIVLIDHRVRLEERYRKELSALESTIKINTFTFRARYLFQIQGPFGEQTKSWLSWSFANEIMFQWGNKLASRVFEQNRTLGGFVFNLQPNLNLALLYQHIFQYQPLRNETVPVNSVRITLLHNLDFR